MHINPHKLGQIAWNRRNWVFLPMMITTFLAIVYALIMPRYWTATQALYVRDEGRSASERLGRFDSVDAMQTAQETILEVARHQSVLVAALRDVGPYRKLSAKRQAAWPSGEAIDTFRGQVFVSAPHGAQFGRTELIYLTVKAETAARAEALAAAVTARLVDRLQQLRRDKFHGIVVELEKAVETARGECDTATRQLNHLEQSVGVDLAELRVLMNEGQGDGNLRRSASEITQEIRQAESRRLAKQKEYELLLAAQDDPRKLVTMPISTLDQQPLLKRMKEGLVEAKLNVSRTLSELNPAHPRSKAAILAEQKIRQQLYQELQAATSVVKHQLDTLDAQIAALRNRSGEASSRLQNLAELRTQYGTLIAEVKQRTALMEAAEAELTTARANLLAASATSLIHPVDKPVPSLYPVGPGRTVIVLCGLLAGLAVGVGLIFLIEPVDGGQQRRWTDQLKFGRRATDLMQLPPSRNTPAIDRRGGALARPQDVIAAAGTEYST